MLKENAISHFSEEHLSLKTAQQASMRQIGRGIS
jgi:hypothetical protein